MSIIYFFLIGILAIVAIFIGRIESGILHFFTGKEFNVLNVTFFGVLLPAMVIWFVLRPFIYLWLAKKGYKYMTDKKDE